MMHQNFSHRRALIVRAADNGRLGSRMESLEQRQLLSLAGELDPTFAQSGWFVSPGTADLTGTSVDAVVQSDGKVIQAISQTDGTLVVQRLNSNGTLDTGYGKSGKTTINFGTGDTIGKLLLLKDGSLIVGGTTGKTFKLEHLKTTGAEDTSFGSGGIATATFSGNTTMNDLELESDGRIVAGGLANTNFALARFHSDGTLDKTFNSTGMLQQNITGNHEAINALTIQSDGKIVAVGNSTDTKGHGHNTIVRFTTAGKLDTSFNSTGIRTFGNNDLQLTGVAMVSGNKILVVSDSSNVDFDLPINIYRLNTNGSTDTSYGKSGVASFSAAQSSKLTIQSDGKAVIAGNTNAPNGPFYAAAFRLNTNGTADTSFGKNGVSQFLLYEKNFANSIAIAPGGKIVMSIDATSTGDIGALPEAVRLTSSGALDTTFGTGGRAGVNLEGKVGTINDMVTQPDGKILVAGSTESFRNGGQDFMVERFNTNGTLDSTFGNGGIAVIDFANRADEARSIALLSSGKIIVSGLINLDVPNEALPVSFGMARLNSNGTLDTTFGSGGKVTYSSTTDPSIVTAMSAAADGSIIASLENTLVRFTATGARDMSFGTNGSISFNFDAQIDQIIQIAGGKILFHISGADFQSGSGDVVARINANGTYDNSFGTNGILGPSADWRGPILDGPNGTFFLARNAGTDSNGVAIDNVDVEQFLADGTFISRTRLPLPALTRYDMPTTLRRGADGKIAVGISYVFNTVSQGTAARFAVARLNADGSQDTSFADGFLSLAPIAVDGTPTDTNANAVAVEPDGSIVQAGAVDSGLFGIARYADSGDGTTGISLDSKTGTLTVNGGKYGDLIDISTVGTNVVVTRNGIEFPFSAASVKSISVSGGDGADYIINNVPISTTLDGGAGDDALITSDGPSVLNGDDGDDVLYGGAAKDALFGGNGNDQLNGGGGDDFLSGLAGNDILSGGAGNDDLDGGTGADIFSGGPGIDTADYSHRTENLTISINGAATSGAPGEGDIIFDIENILGGSGNDSITGDSGANSINGGAGNDTIHGGAGNDTLTGGPGNDQLFGEADNDTIFAQDGAKDTIDGGTGTDTAQRDNSASVMDSVVNIEIFI